MKESNTTNISINNDKLEVKLGEKSKHLVKKKGKGAKVFCRTCCISFLNLFFIFIVDILLATIFFYYDEHSKKCESKLYTKIKTIIKLYIAILIIKIGYLFFSYMIDLCKSKAAKIIGNIGVLVTSVALLTLAIIQLVIVQRNYKKTKSWNNCGNFKGWMTFWLIYNYIALVIIFIVIICSICLKRKK